MFSEDVYIGIWTLPIYSFTTSQRVVNTLKKRTENLSCANVLCFLNGDCLSRNAVQAMCNAQKGDKFQGKPRKRTLNIRYGNGAVIVVRARESLVHGEGQQVIY